METEIKRAKRFNYVVLTIVILFWAVVIGVMVYHSSKPLSDSVTVSALKMQTSEENDCILAKIDEEYYQMSASDDFGGLFGFDSWELVSKGADGEKIITLRFGELYYLDIYDNGYAAAYNEYASSKTVPEACYLIPADTADSVITYLRQYGIPRELGDGMIGMGTFLS